MPEGHLPELPDARDHEPPVTVSFEVTQWDQSKLLDYLAANVADRFEAQLETIVRERVERYVDQAIDELARGKLAELVDDVIEQGWQEQDSWGNRGRHVTFRERVVQLLVKDRHNHRRDSLIADTIRDQADKVIRTECREALDQAKAKFSEQVDEVLQVGLKKAMREGLGLSGR